MILRRLTVALALVAAVQPAWAADLLTIYRDARVSDPVYQRGLAFLVGGEINANIERAAAENRHT